MYLDLTAGYIGLVYIQFYEYVHSFIQCLKGTVSSLGVIGLYIRTI
jgi:hypothetical protein